MVGSAYEAVAFAMRYWFLFVIAGILVAVIRISRKEFSEKRHVKNAMSQYLGYLEIVGGPEDFIGDRFGVREQNTIGSSAKSDIVLPDETVKKAHALLYMEDGELFLSPTSKSDTGINGRRAVNKHRLKTGDIVSIGAVDFYVYIKRTRLEHDG